MIERRRTSSGDIESLVLDAALSILEDEGVENLTVRNIAQCAGVAPMGIYNHFAGKLDVVDALVRQGFLELTEALEVRKIKSSRGRLLVDVGLAYRQFALTHPRQYQLMFMVSIPSYEPSVPTATAMAQSFQVLVGIIEDLQAAGEIRVGDPFSIAQSTWSVVHGYSSLELVRVNFAAKADATFERLLEDHVVGLRPR